MFIVKLLSRLQVPGKSLREIGAEHLHMKEYHSSGCHKGSYCAFSNNPILRAALNPKYDKIIAEALDADVRRHDKEIYLSNYQSLVLQRYASDSIRVPQFSFSGYEKPVTSLTILAVKKHCKVATVPDYVNETLRRQPVPASFWDLRTSLQNSGSFRLLQYFPNADSTFAAWVSM